MEREFNNNLIMDNGPHIYSDDSVRRRMALVIIALLPQLLASFAVFGSRSLVIVIVSVIFCMACQLLLDIIRRRRPFLDDLTCVVTGMIIAYGLPSNVKLWIVLAADAAAILIVKGLIRGRGRNLVNPAAFALTFVYAALSGFMELWPAPIIGDPDIPADASVIPDAVDILEGAEGVMPINWELFLGFCAGPLGQVSTIALLAGGLFLIWKRVIAVNIPLSILATCAAISLLAGRDVLTMLCSGGTVFLAFFMAADPVTSPVKGRAQTVYGIMIGIAYMVLRMATHIDYSAYAVLLVMNLLGLLIDKLFDFEWHRGRKKRAV